MQTAREFLSTFESFCYDRAGASPADVGIVNAAVYEALLSARASLIRAEKDRTSVNEYVLQNIGCLEMEEVTTEECPCAPPSGCTWFRTVRPIPLPVDELHSVTSIGGNLQKLKHYTFRAWHLIKFSLYARSEAERTRGYYSIKNNYLYLTSPHVKAVSISGIFYDPVETQRHPQCGKPFSTCSPFLDYSIYVDPSHTEALLANTYQLIRGLMGQTPFDNKNDGKGATTVEA